MKNRKYISYFCIGLFALLAISLQIQISLFAKDDYLGLRLNLADLYLPLSGFIILGSLIFKQSSWPTFNIRYAYLWIIGLSIIITASFVHGYWLYGELSQWALINKTIGWFILCAYFMLGGWLATNTNEETLVKFVHWFIYAFASITIAVLSIKILQHYKIVEGLYPWQMPVAALMGNKNAFLVLMLFTFSLIIIWRPKIFNIELLYVAAFFLPIVYIFTGGRAAILALPVLCILFWVLDIRKIWPKTIICFIIGLLAMQAIDTTVDLPLRFLHKKHLITAHHIDDVLEKDLGEIQSEIKHRGDSERLRIIDTSINMIKERPLTGHGIGSSKIEQEKQWGEFINIIDCTPLWLWVETGLFGLIAFLTFYGLALFQGIKGSYDKTLSDAAQKLHKSLICLLAVFALMCLFHEILYTRFVWFFMGLILATPLIKKSVDQK